MNQTDNKSGSKEKLQREIKATTKEGKACFA